MSEKYVLEAGDPVLVRVNEKSIWSYSLFSHRDSDGYYWAVNASIWEHCIPFEGNEHLLGTTEDPNKAEEEKENYTSRQDAWIKETGCKAGSIVLIEGAASTGEAGWGDSWDPNMSKKIGTYGIVMSHGDKHGIHVIFHDCKSWYFPFFCLKKVL